MKVSTSLFLVAGMAFAAPSWALDGHAGAGQQKNAMCKGCHGIPGYRTAFPQVYTVPKIAGQQASYIVSALHAYKAGERPHPSMHAIASGLSDQDMADLAAFYSSQH